ncbi:AhpC/TSA antioxidant enzyme-domain-containing protein [Infundibulicybe gibba]|nr:AhpC/TSA antioxidant enzyme-domain-containing protein [Infundibulicybe gibba]
MADLKRLPDASAISDASQLDILNLKGEPVKFGSVFENDKVIVVFIRHFFCGSCQSYIKQLASVSQSALEAAGVKIVVIGCGEWNPITTYAEFTDFRGEIYADPSRKLYRALGTDIETTATTPAGQQRRSYRTTSVFVNATQSIWRMLQNPKLIGKQGNVSQLGGDFIFGPGAQCTFASRMQHTEDRALSLFSLLWRDIC